MIILMEYSFNGVHTVGFVDYGGVWLELQKLFKAFNLAFVETIE